MECVRRRAETRETTVSMELLVKEVQGEVKEETDGRRLWTISIAEETIKGVRAEILPSCCSI
jgi:hypothetical protein